MELEIFHYEQSNSFISRMHPLSKFLIMLLLCFLVFKANLYCMIYIICIIALSIVSLKINIGVLIKNSKLLLFYFILIVLANSAEFIHETEFAITANQSLSILIYIGRLYIVFLLSELFFLSTSLWDLANEITVNTRKILRKLSIDPGFFISLTIGYIPKILSFYRITNDAAVCRGYTFSLFQLKPTLTVLSSFIYRSFLKVFTNIEALEVRSYNSGRSVFKKRLSFFDSAILLINLLIVIVSRIFR